MRNAIGFALLRPPIRADSERSMIELPGITFSQESGVITLPRSGQRSNEAKVVSNQPQPRSTTAKTISLTGAYL